MADEKTFELEIELKGQGSTQKFRKMQDIENFVTQEREFWEWERSINDAELKNIKSEIGGGLRQAGQLLEQYQRQQDTPSKNALTQHITNLYQTKGLPPSNSKVGKFIGLLAEDNPRVALSAAAAWMSVHIPNPQKFETIKGIMLMAAFDENMTKRTATGVKRSLETLDQKYRDAINQADSKIEDAEKLHEQQLKRFQKEVAKTVVSAKSQNEKLRTEIWERVDKSIASIKEVEATYKEHMKLKGPVEYWSKKATDHKKSAVIRLWVLGIFSLVGSAALLGALWWLAEHALEVATTDRPPAVYFVLSTIGVVITTIVFWIARILTRLFLSEHHLAIDAKERSVMAETYLALTAEGEADEKDRAIVLASLFRPTADGIVKDDGAPTLSPSSIISSFGSKG